MNYFAVGISGAGGVMLRYWISNVFLVSPHFPIETLCINWLGSFILPYIIGRQLFTNRPFIKLALTTGLLGGFTTFSTFSYVDCL